LEHDFAPQVAVGDRGHDPRDAAHLVGEVAGHQVDAVGEVLPGSGDALDLRLAAQLAFRPNLASHPGDFRGKGVQLVDHDVDRVLELEDFTPDFDRDLLRQVAPLDRGGDLGDVAHLGGEVGGELVDVIGEVAPGAGGAQHVGLAAQAALGADFACHARDLCTTRLSFVVHDVDRVLQLEDFAADVDRDLLRQVAAGDGGRHLRDVAHLGGEVARHRVDVVGQVLPGAGGGRDVGLAAQPALGADRARHPGDLAGEGVELIDHDVDRLLQLTDLAVHIDGDLFREITFGDGGRHLGDVAHLGGEVAGHVVDVVGQVFPHARHALHLRLAAQLALDTGFAGHPGDLAGAGVHLADHGVDRVFQLADLAPDVDGDLLGEVAGRHRRGDVGDVAHLGCQVGRHQVHV